MKSNNSLSPFKNLRDDIPASIVVFLVAMPLCLGIAMASGAPLYSGLISGIIGGIVVGALSNSALGVSGPAAGLAVIVLNAITDLGGFEIFLVAVILAGIIQVIMGFARAGIIAYFFPSSVIHGMLAGIGIIIFLKQIPHAFGYDIEPEGDFEFVQVDGHNTFDEFAYMLDSISPGVLIISAISLAILILWGTPFFKRMKFTKLIQGPLVAVVVGVILVILFKTVPDLAVSKDHMVSVPMPKDFDSFMSNFTLPDFSALAKPEVYMTAIVIAVVASLETLLCVEASDKQDSLKRITPTNRELKAQGVGNIVAGFIGGLPVTQVIVRSSANQQSGGKTKASTIAHGILLLLSVILIPNVLNMIPLGVLAAILLVVGYKLANPKLFKKMKLHLRLT
jgi:MFS superfamily sulfate permease-like transporter